MDNTTINVFDSTVAEVIEQTNLEKRLKGNRPLIIKLGVDPTSPDLHLGHAVVLRKLRQFQDLGHVAALVIGDFTAQIGDPSGRNSTRPVITKEEIGHNLKTYIDQAKLILNMDKAKVMHNSVWLSKITLSDFIRTAAQVSVNTLLERDDFSDRLKDNQSLLLHELIYPVSQAIDSVELKADVEIGGWDQRLNLLMGRELQKKMGQVPQEIVILKPLIGLDGERKMSKSLGNYIGLTEDSDNMFGKLMSIPDKLIMSYAELAAGLSSQEIENLPEHPRDAKATVAEKIVSLYHSSEDAKMAVERFKKTFSERQGGDSLADEVAVKGVERLTLVEAVRLSAGVSGSEASRLIGQKAVKINGETVEDPNFIIDVGTTSYQLQIGKHRFYELTKE